MSARRTNFLKVFLIEAGPSPELLIAFVIGLIVIGVAGNLVYALATAPWQVLAVWWQPLLAIAGGTALAYLFYWLDQRNERKVVLTFDESRSVPGHKGLIWLLGPGNFDHLLTALDHHRRHGGAEHCWLLMQADFSPVRETFADLTRTAEIAAGKTRLHPIYLDQLDVQHTYHAVRSIYEREAQEAGLAPEEVIGDITGGIKPMTAGMVLGTLATGRSILEYIETDHTPEGKYIPGTAHVVKVDVNFLPSQVVAQTS